MIDATWIGRRLVNFDLPDTFCEKASDVDGDKEITAVDAAYILRWLADMEVPFPIDELA